MWSRAELEDIKSMLILAAQNGDYQPDPLLPFLTEPSQAVFEVYKAATVCADVD